MSTAQSNKIEECLERIDHTSALLESQLTELRGLCTVRRGSARCDDLEHLCGHLMGMAIVAAHLAGATDDNIKALVSLILEPDA
jgi:hypothetical protein